MTGTKNSLNTEDSASWTIDSVREFLQNGKGRSYRTFVTTAFKWTKVQADQACRHAAESLKTYTSNPRRVLTFQEFIDDSALSVTVIQATIALDPSLFGPPHLMLNTSSNPRWLHPEFLSTAPHTTEFDNDVQTLFQAVFKSAWNQYPNALKNSNRKVISDPLPAYTYPIDNDAPALLQLISRAPTMSTSKHHLLAPISRQSGRPKADTVWLWRCIVKLGRIARTQDEKMLKLSMHTVLLCKFCRQNGSYMWRKLFKHLQNECDTRQLYFFGKDAPKSIRSHMRLKEAITMSYQEAQEMGTHFIDIYSAICKEHMDMLPPAYQSLAGHGTKEVYFRV